MKKENINEKIINDLNREEHENKMNPMMKLLIALAGCGCVSLIAYGVITLNTTKENEIKEATQVVQMTDSTQKNEVETVVDETIQFQEEAETLWKENSDKFICEENVFISKYVNYRQNGNTSEQAYNSLYNEFGIENQIETTESGEAKATLSDMDTLINSEDENTTKEEVTEAEEIVIDFEVKEIEATTMYALQNMNLRQGPDAKDFNKVGSLQARQSVVVTGIVEEYKGKTVLWYRLEDGTFGSGAYLVDKLPAENNNTNNNNNSGNNSGSNGGNSSGGSTGGFKVPGGGSTGVTVGTGGQATTGGSGGSTDLKLQ